LEYESSSEEENNTTNNKGSDEDISLNKSEEHLKDNSDLE